MRKKRAVRKTWVTLETGETRETGMNGSRSEPGERREARGERGITNYDFRGTIGEEAGLPAVGLAKAGDGVRPPTSGFW